MRRNDGLEKDLNRALTTPQPEVPEAALAAARNLFTERSQERPNTLARLLFDSREGLSPARDSGGMGSFQRVFETETHLIDLWEERSGGRSYLIGQAYDKTSSVAEAPDSALLLGSNGTTLSASAEGTEWHLAGVPVGSWTVQLWLNGETIILDAVEVGG